MNSSFQIVGKIWSNSQVIPMFFQLFPGDSFGKWLLFFCHKFTYSCNLFVRESIKFFFINTVVMRSVTFSTLFSHFNRFHFLCINKHYVFTCFPLIKQKYASRYRGRLKHLSRQRNSCLQPALLNKVSPALFLFLTSQHISR